MVIFFFPVADVLRVAVSPVVVVQVAVSWVVVVQVVVPEDAEPVGAQDER